MLGHPDNELACALYAKAFDLAELPEAAFNVGVLYGVVDFRGQVDRATAAKWYAAGAECDVSSCEHKYKGLMALGGDQNESVQNCRKNLAAVSRCPEVVKMFSES